MATLQLGNTAPVEIVKTETGRKVTQSRKKRGDLGDQVTTVSFPAGMDLAEQLAAVTSLWESHSDEPPQWADSDDGLLAEVVARKFTTGDHECVVGRPKSWKES